MSLGFCHVVNFCQYDVTKLQAPQKLEETLPLFTNNHSDSLTELEARMCACTGEYT